MGSMDLSKLRLSDKIIGGAGILLIIDLLFLPWHDINIDLGIVSASATRTAIESPDAFWGVLALLLTIAVVAVAAIRVFKPETTLPDLPVTWDQALFFATIAVAVLLLLKLVVNTDYLGFGAWLGIILAAGLAYGGFLKSKEETGAAAI